jgi:hypothetical protein
MTTLTPRQRAACAVSLTTRCFARGLVVMLSNRCLALVAGAACALGSASAHATNYTFDWNPSTPNPPGGSFGYNAAGGAINQINSSFNSVTKQFTFNVAFGPATGSSSLSTKGYWLVINNGPNPKDMPGQYAILYFDASTPGAPKLSVYGYNGKNAADSFADGNGSAAGSPAGDLIKGINETSFIQSIGASDANGKRTFSLTIDASSIISHSPVYGTPQSWEGIGYDEHVGIWLHPVQTFNASYSGARGGISSLQLGGEGWLDGNYLRAVPAPGAVTLAGLGGLLIARRRRA